MRSLNKFLIICSLAAITSAEVYSAAVKSNIQFGLGIGPAGSSPASSFPTALMAVLEGTYRKKFFGVSILAIATSSQQVNGTYWFGEQGGYQQTFLEPRVYVSIFKFGLAVGLNLSSGSSGDIRSMTSYGPLLGIELPLGRFSLGIDGRYLLTSGSNPTPLSATAMLRFRL